MLGKINETPLFVEKKKIPNFDASTPTSNPLKRNMDIDFWL